MLHNKVELSLNTTLKALFVIIALVSIFYYGAPLLLPVIVAILFAVILASPVNKFVSWGVPEWLSLSITLLLFFLLATIASIAITWQFGEIANEWPEIQEKSEEKYEQIQRWSENNFDVNIFQYFAREGAFANEVNTYIKALASSFTEAVYQIFITVVYLVFFLMQRKMFLNFLYRIVPDKSHHSLSIILKQSGETISRYIYGKAVIIIILFITYFVGFLIGDVPHALFLALFASLFSIIPYIGNILGGGIAMVLATIYSGFMGGIIVFSVVGISQLVESYVLTPIIIGDQIDLNPFVTIFGVIAFTLLWGITGAVISLPILGIIKVISSQVVGLENLHYLLEKEKKT